MKKQVIWRIVLSILTLSLWGWAKVLFAAKAQLAVGEAAGGQLANSDSAYLEFVAVQHFFNGGALPVALLLAVMLFIWWKPVSALLSKETASKLALVVLFGSAALGYQPDANAYYDQTDRAEWAEIGSNQSAFLLPMVGANKDKQSKFGSVEYLNENKVAAKRVQIPHVKADNTGALRDYYVPTSRLFILDRTPYTREWAKAEDKGTSARNEGFRVESADSLTIETAITISAMVTEEDAAKFFYWFGTKNGNASTRPEDVFASVNYGRSLADVMDTVVRGQVQAVLAKEFGKRKLVDAIAQKAAIIEAVETTIKEEYSKKGITVMYVGFADELTLDPKIQATLNEIFTVNAKYAAKDAYTAVVEIERKQAENSVRVATGNALLKWDGKIPSIMIGLENFFNSVMSWFKSDSASVKK